MLILHAENARPDAAKVIRTFCDDNFLRIARYPRHAPDSPDLAPSDFSCLGISTTASKDSNSSLQIKFFRESDKFWTKSALTLWKRFSGSGSTDWTDALQQMERTGNEVNNDPLRYL
jgi:hypothetical protein